MIVKYLILIIGEDKVMLVEAEVWTVARTDQGNAVLIRPLGAEVAVPIFIGQLETQSILIGMGNVPMPRPLTHDLFITLFKQLGLVFQRIEVTSLKDGTFFAKLVIQKNSEQITIDARPSDAIGIAVREKCPIFIAEAVVDEAGIPLSSITERAVNTEEEEKISEIEETEKKSSVKPEETEKSRLEKELDEAVEQENYEEAARIRDRLKDLDDNQE